MIGVSAAKCSAGLIGGDFTVGLSSRDQPFYHGIPHMSKYVTFLFPLGEIQYLEESSNPLLEESGNIQISILGTTQEGDPACIPYCPQDYLSSAIS